MYGEDAMQAHLLIQRTCILWVFLKNKCVLKYGFAFDILYIWDELMQIFCWCVVVMYMSHSKFYISLDR